MASEGRASGGPAGGGAMDPVRVGLEHPQEENRLDPPHLLGRPSGLGASTALPVLLPSPFVSRFSLSLTLLFSLPGQE